MNVVVLWPVYCFAAQQADESFAVTVIIMIDFI